MPFTGKMQITNKITMRIKSFKISESYKDFV